MLKLGIRPALILLAVCLVLFLAGAALVFPPLVLGVLLMVFGAGGAAGLLWGVEV